VERAVLFLLPVGLITASACVVPDVDLDGRPCPCAMGWVCDDTRNVCVRPDDGSTPDGGTDSSTPDTSIPDGAPGDTSVDSSVADSGLDACSLATVTEEWGDRPGTDHPGTILDTWINLNMEHHASDDALLLYTWPAAQVANAIIIKWDLSAIPAGATVTEATVHLSQWEAAGADYQTTAHRIERCDPDITGNTVDGYQCAEGESWTPNTCCTRGVPMGQADIAAPDDTQVLDLANGDKSWNVTAMVQTWVSDPSTNLGMMINSDPSAPADDRRSFRSNEYPTAAERPRLVVTYGSCD
jgi:hypothetical protein